MKQAVLLLLALALAAALPAVEGNRNEVVWWEEDFESAGHGWTHYTELTNMWHSVTDWSWYIYSDYWLMGPGYLGDQYFVLDTPPSTLSDTTATLTFQYRINIQEPAGASPPYDGYDAFNVRISTDGGSTWIPIYGTPAYDMASSYAFGEEFGEGPGIPGWAENTGAFWQTASFDLGAYVGQAVRIRFAFASSAVLSPDNYFVWLDDIAFGDYINLGENDGQMVSTSLGLPPEDIWHVAIDGTAPSPIRIMRCQNDQGSYDRLVRNCLVSPPIQLPDNGSIRADFMLRGGYGYSYYGDDYFVWEVCGDDLAWHSMVYDTWWTPYTSIQYDDPPSEWSSLVDHYYYGGIDFDQLELSGYWHPYSGQTVRFRWTFVTDYNAPLGIGLCIDDLKIYHTLNIEAPENLQASLNGCEVVLSWDQPGTGEGKVREVDYYRVFRDGSQIAQIDGALHTYTDDRVNETVHAYYLIATMDDYYESEPSDTVSVTIIPATFVELSHDDGSAEFTLGIGVGQTAVHYNYGQSIRIRYIKAYIRSPQYHSLIIRVFDNDGAGGMPGTLLAQSQYSVSQDTEGWKYLGLQEDIVVPDGDFYIGTQETTQNSYLGLDRNSSGFSYKNTGQGWILIPVGEIMLHAFVQSTVTTEDNTLIPPALDLSNYPNPFNPETTISYTLPASGPVSLEIYNSRGQLVRRLLHEEQPAGGHSLVWNGKDDTGHSVASGLYLCRIACTGKHETRKMLLLK
ncbi:MAG TPA: FlgD immunoglobulin-like domain containing protein [Candidatus Syntrophosphaera sp.]|nr:FlgD immunoglobulin-like domain containing protein [Candidatus Syntrophosphaera sp.]